jgi:hypothetical protein
MVKRAVLIFRVYQYRDRRAITLTILNLSLYEVSHDISTFLINYSLSEVQSSKNGGKNVGCVTSPVLRTGLGFILVIDRGG